MMFYYFEEFMRIKKNKGQKHVFEFICENYPIYSAGLLPFNQKFTSYKEFVLFFSE